MSQSPAPFRVQTQNDDPLLNGDLSAEYLGLEGGRKTLDKWRSEGRYPELVPTRVGRRVFYRKSALEAFLKARTGA
ncbi:MAG: helix-turn-helix domain-containing protein [Candidatus Melainabacteria bacterium]|nr:helix-turn-helix domain-containing protein [Candidatus Melainabacteria bacterium]